jgi:pantetheine-phosphate adenylyltransferase, bacterial
MNERIAVFAGSFDPLTIGHEDVVQRALPLFDKIIVAIGDNIAKKTYFTIEQRLDFLHETFDAQEKIEVCQFSCLFVDFCKQKGAKYALRGLRNSVDFQYEKNLALINQKLYAELETIFLLTKTDYEVVSSSFVREILAFGGDVKQFVPEKIQHCFNKN